MPGEVAGAKHGTPALREHRAARPPAAAGLPTVAVSASEVACSRHHGHALICRLGRLLLAAPGQGWVILVGFEVWHG